MLSDIPGPLILFGEISGPGFVELTYDQDIAIPGIGETAPWIIKTNGFAHPATSLELVGPRLLNLSFGPPGPPAPGNSISYIPPPVAVTGLTAIPAQPQIDFPLD